MPTLKPISGHRSVKWLRRYLEGEGGERVLGSDFWNIGERNGRAGRGWDAQMDLTRHEFGNDVPWKGRVVQTYKHYILSPDPRDEVTLETLRDVTMQWVERNFPDFEVAVVYHDDNTNRIPHAHVVINNTNLESGRRLSAYMTDSKVREVGRDLNRLAREMGLRSFTTDHRSLTPEEMASTGATASDGAAARVGHSPQAERDGRVSGRPGARRGPRALEVETIAERGARERTGSSWKGEVRRIVEIARLSTTDERTFMRLCGLMGVEVREGARGDWVYALDRDRSVSARRLGASFSRASIRRAFALDYAGWRQRSTRPARPARPLSAAQREAIVRSVSVIGRGTSATLPSLEEIARTLRYNREHSVSSLADYATLAGPDAERARSCAEAIGLFDAEARERDTREARADARVVLDWMAERDARGEGGREAYAQGAHANREGRERGGQQAADEDTRDRRTR